MSAHENTAIAADLERDVIKLAERLSAARQAARQVIFGQDDVIDQCLIVILSGGHFLLTGLPGLGKTRLVDTLGTVMGLDHRRVQCTPDLMPADILGSEILSGDGAGKGFRFIQGPVFSQLLMADEINRASPRTQAALLQAMQEYHVSVGGTTYPLPRPFHVLATQNPLEHEGTYPLPEAQLDRFMMEIIVGYPDHADERRMLLATTGTQQSGVVPVFAADEVMAAQGVIRRLPVGDQVVDGILALVRAGRPEQSPVDNVRKYVDWGPGPRAAQAFMLAARARALLDGRFAPSLDDVVALAPAILRHRMALNFAARADRVTLGDVIDEMCEVID